MKKIKFFLMKCAALLILVFLFGQGLFAAPDILVDLRLYQGEREKKSVEPTVVTSYYLRPISSAGKILDMDLSDEKEELKKIFNLVDIKLMTQAKWAWKTGLRGKHLELIVLNGRKFIVQLTILKKKDHFRLEVLEAGKKKEKENLQAVLIIPQGKTSVFGFEDTLGKPYFLSCQRHPDKEGVSDEPVKVPALKRPKLIKKVKPVYPEAALRAGIQGQVNAEVVTDIYGRVVDIAKIEGHPLLNEATVKALRGWVYEPFILNGKPKFVTFTVVVSFNLDKKGEEANVKVEEPVKVSFIKKPKLIKKIKPVYPVKAIEEGITGEVIIEAVTDVMGKVEKVTKVTGHPRLTPEAIDAVKQWLYEPYIIDGKPEAVKFTIVVNFNLDKKKGDPMRIPSFKKPKLIKKKDPQYPEKAKKEKVSGRVVLEATADKAGNVTDVNVISGHALLAESAVEAVKQWKYEPFIKDGKAEAVRFTVVVNFQLEKKSK